MFGKIKSLFLVVKKAFSRGFARVGRVIEKRPLTSFFTALFILLILIAAGSFLRKPAPATEKSAIQPKKVEVYNIGSAPKVTVQAQTEKSGVIQIVAQSGGVVSFINVKEGMDVARGTNILSLSTNYAGGNALSLQRQIAQTQYKNVLDTYDAQKDVINKNRDIANKSDENASDLRDITSKSIDETQALINLENDMMNPINKALDAYTATNSAGQNDAAILGLKAQKIPVQSALNQLMASLRQSQYQSASDKPPAQLADLQRDIALKQLDLQEKALDLNREISRLQLCLAQVNEALMYPSAPFAGRVERIFVREGQVVSPGTPLISFSGDTQELTAVAYVPQNIAASVSKLEASTLHINGEDLSIYPAFVSDEAVNGLSYAVIFSIPSDMKSKLIDHGYITVDIPIGYPDTTASVPYIPLDSVHQTQDGAFVYLEKKGKAIAQAVTLGDVYGQYISVSSGLSDGDRVIKDRTVIDNDPVK